MSDDLSIFVSAVQGCPTLSQDTKDHADETVRVRREVFDHKDVARLDRMIKLDVGGLIQKLAQRRDPIAQHLGREVLVGTVLAGNVQFTIWVDPVDRSVLYWQAY